MSDEQDIYNDEAPKKNEEKRKESDRLRKRYFTDLRKLLGMPEFRRVVWHFFGLAGVFRNSFSANANQTAFNEGRRDIGLALLADVNKADSDAYPRMQREYWSERQKNQEAE